MEDVLQFYVNVENEEAKFKKLCNLYEALCITSQSVIFVNSTPKAEWLTQQMRTKSCKQVYVINEETDRFKRDRIVYEFHNGTCSAVLITSVDLFDSKINAEVVTVALNYDLPDQVGHYRRIERFGRSGVAINFVTKDEKTLLQDVEKACDIDIRELPF